MIITDDDMIEVLLKILGNKKKRAILRRLKELGEATQTLLAATVGMSRSLVSTYLQQMRKIGIVSTRDSQTMRGGMRTVFALNEPSLEFVVRL